MSTLPTGTVTFVFTDIEGSTQMVQRLGDAGFASVLEQHNGVMRTGLASGVEIRSEGDAFFFVFTSAADAVAGAVAVQRALAVRSWPAGATVRVRIGMHTGEGRLGGDDYVGFDIHRAARISAAGHGGQILVSDATRTAAAGGLAASASFRDLGLHHFKDLNQPERVYQVTAEGLAATHPAIRSLDTRPNNLPSGLSTFVGRARETDEVADLLEQARLVTLTGPGGSGKTRLGVEVGGQVLGRFQHGVTFVPLEGLRSPDYVVPAIAERLGLGEEGAASRFEAVRDRLAQDSRLLILDSFEHVLEAAPDIGRLLEAAPGLHILATSQSLLRLRGEQVYQLPPLTLPEAVELFATRVSAADSSFVVTAGNLATIEGLVTRLDALPLALELAAPRVRLFGLDGVLSRLSSRLDLSTGSVDGPARHHTLRHAIAWSYDLLSTPEQSLLRHLSVFDGGFVLEAAEQVVPPDEKDDAIEAVASLFDKSLLKRRLRNGEARFFLLDSIREFALERLGDGNEFDPACDRHAAFYAELAEEAQPHLAGTDQALWLDRLAVEHDNLRAVVRRGIDRSIPDPGLRCLGAAWRFYHRRGHMLEAASGLEQLLAIPGASEPATAVALNGLAALLYWQSNYAEALIRYEEALALYRTLGDRLAEADTLFGLSTTSSILGDVAEGAVYAELAKQAYADAGAPELIRNVVGAQAIALWFSGDLAGAATCWAEAEELFAAAGDRAEQLQSRAAQAVIQHQLGHSDDALERLGPILDDMVAAADVTGIVLTLDFTSAILVARDPSDAVRMSGAATRLRDELGGGLQPEVVGISTAREAASGVMLPADIDAAWNEGALMDLDQAVAFARSVALH